MAEKEIKTEIIRKNGAVVDIFIENTIQNFYILSSVIEDILCEIKKAYDNNNILSMVLKNISDFIDKTDGFKLIHLSIDKVELKYVVGF